MPGGLSETAGLPVVHCGGQGRGRRAQGMLPEGRAGVVEVRQAVPVGHFGTQELQRYKKCIYADYQQGVAVGNCLYDPFNPT